MRPKIKVTFWGVRGSLAAHRLENRRYGGHTSCVAIHFENQCFVCDAGTGISLLGQRLAKTKGSIAVLLSHLHWDHIFGLPFFKPLYQRKRKIILGGPSFGRAPLKKMLRQIMRPPFFPVGPFEWNSHILWKNMKEGRFSIGKVVMEAKKVCHPDGALGFKFFFPDGRRLIYVADQELIMNDKEFVRWIRGADLLIHDAQYDQKEYAKHKGWGHSAFETVLELAMQGEVKKLILSHHDPNAGDRLLEKRLKWCQRRLSAVKSPLKCFLAKEGWSLSF